jgi:two-component system chemotaxis sensor kinase CheA
MDPSATLAEVFRAEAEVVLDHVARAVEQLRPGNATDAPAVVDGMLRHLHNLKGAASSVGNRVVEELAHAAEEVLLPSRGRTEGPDASTLDVIEEAVAALGLAAKGQALEAANTLLARIGKPADDQPAEGSNELGPETVDVEEIAEGRDETTLRVPAARLDALVGLTAELTMAEARLQHRGETLGDLLRDVRELSRSRPADPALTRLRKRVDRMVQLERRELLDFHHLTGELRDGVRQLRMIPLASQEPLWRAVARESAATMHRRARLTCRLGTLELDKVVLDALGPATPASHGKARFGQRHGREVPSSS